MKLSLIFKEIKQLKKLGKAKDIIFDIAREAKYCSNCH